MRVRLLTKQDRPLFEKWLEKDELHKQLGITWDNLGEWGTTSYVVLDDDGEPLIFVRIHTAMRVAMQFNPDRPYKTAKIAKEVVEWLQNLADDKGAREVIIRPGGKAEAFAEKLGFRTFTAKFIEV